MGRIGNLKKGIYLVYFSGRVCLVYFFNSHTVFLAYISMHISLCLCMVQ